MFFVKITVGKIYKAKFHLKREESDNIEYVMNFVEIE